MGDQARREVFDIERIVRSETILRRRLEAEPADTVSRTALAWCLLLRAVYQDGRAAGLSERPAARVDGAAGGVPAPPVNPPGLSGARDLLRESLRQTLPVSHLSLAPAEREQVRQLLTLVRIAGAADVIAEAEAHEREVLEDLWRNLHAA